MAVPDENINSAQLTEPIRKEIKIGLVLAGGGGKGAYQVGVYRFICEFFSQRSLGRFEAISGTSVGALNALLFATASPAEALDIWRKLADFLKTPGTRKRKRSENIVAYATVLLLSVLPVVTLFGSLAVYELSHRSIALGIAAFLFALSVVGTVMVSESASKAFFYFANMVERSAIDAVIKLVVRRFNRLVIEYLPQVIAVLIFLGVICITTLCWPFGPEPFFKDAWVGFPKFIANVAIWVPIFTASIALWKRIEKKRQKAIKETRDFGWYDPSALVDVARDRASIPPARWRSKFVFATMARRGLYFDPERNSEVFDTGVTPPPPDGSWVQNEWLPEYLELSGVDANERLKTLITSCAIPIAFPTFDRENGFFCDGALVDNVPVLPLVTNANCDIIIVVSLDCRQSHNLDHLCKTLDALWTKLEINAAAPRSESRENQWECAEEIRRSFDTEQSIRRRPSTLLKQIRLVYVVPKKKLKGVLSFPLNSICELEQLGYEDARSTFPEQFDIAFAQISELKPFNA